MSFKDELAARNNSFNEFEMSNEDPKNYQELQEKLSFK